MNASTAITITLDHLIEQGRYAHNLRTRIFGRRLRAALAAQGVESVNLRAEGPTGFYIDLIVLSDRREHTVGPLVARVSEALHTCQVHTFDEVVIVADSSDSDSAVITAGGGAGPDEADLFAEFADFFRFGQVVALA